LPICWTKRELAVVEERERKGGWGRTVKKPFVLFSRENPGSRPQATTPPKTSLEAVSRGIYKLSVKPS
jgi:hypothetical protein